jgi:hypothetical protein
MLITSKSNISLIEVVDCLPLVSALSNLVQVIASRVFDYKSERSLSSHLFYSIPFVGNVYKIAELVYRYFSNFKSSEVSNIEKRPLLSPSLPSPPKASNLVKEPVLLREVVGLSSSKSAKKLRFSSDMGPGRLINRFLDSHKFLRDTRMVDIKPDGHCLFRSFCYSLLDKLSNNQSQKEAVCNRLQAWLEQAVAHEEVIAAHPHLALYVKTLQDLIRYSTPVLTLLNDTSTLLPDPINLSVSDFFIQVMRTLVCAQHRMSINLENQDHQALLQEHLDPHEIANFFTEYLPHMNSLDPVPHYGETAPRVKFGAYLEQKALSDIFRVTSFNFMFHQGIQEGVKICGEDFQSALTISYFYTPGHYDVLQIDPGYLVHRLSLKEQEDPFMGLRPLISN